METVTSNLIEAIRKDNDIYVLAFESSYGFPLPEGVREAFYFKSKDTAENAAYFNWIIRTCRITHVVNQGIYHIISGIVFNDARDRSVKVLSELHGMPGYERMSYWWDFGTFKNLKHKVAYALGYTRSYHRYIDKFSDSYRKAAIEGDRVILLSESYHEDFCRMYDIPAECREKICVIPNLLSKRYSDVTEPDFVSKENILLYVGRMSKEKNISLAIDAWKLIYKRLPNWKFVIVGDGPLRENLEKRAVGIGNIEFAGTCTDPTPYYRKAGILLLTSRFEGFGMVLVEAQRFGTVPVAYPCSGGVADILAGGGGVSVSELTAEAYSEAICNIAMDKAGRETLARSAYTKSEQYTMSAVAERWQRLFSL